MSNAARHDLVGIWGVSPLFARGLIAELQEAGFEAEQVPCLDEWDPVAARGLIVVIGEHVEADQVYSFAQRFPTIALVGVAPDHSVDMTVRAIESGCRAVVSQMDPADTLVAALHLLIESNLTAIPDAAALLLARQRRHVPNDIWISERESKWLHQMARGDKVTRIASESGYSERELFRLLSDLYGRLGVTTRSEALVVAARWGILDDVETSA